MKFVKIRIEIIDDGVGIKKENLSKLFMDFSKLDEHSKINTQGTGLGLSICKRIIEQMGGTVSVESEEGVGTTFSINLLTKSRIKNPIYLQIQNENNNNDDKDEIFINNLKKLPKKINKNLGPINLGQFDANNKKNIDLISGKQQEENQGKKLSQRISISKNSSSGISNNIKENINKSEEDKHWSGKKYSCIVANDDNFQRIIIEYLLKQLGVEILLIAINGHEVMQYVQKYLDKKIDFILLDLDMPIMNGYEACQNICNIYNNDNKLFRKNKNKLLETKNKKGNQQQLLQRSNSLPLIKNQFAFFQEIWNEINQKPLLVAYSGLINEAIIIKAQQVGFEIILEGTLSQQIIKEEIFSRLLANKNFQGESINFNEFNNKSFQCEKKQLNNYKLLSSSKINSQNFGNISGSISLKSSYNNNNHNNNNYDNKIEEIEECEEQSLQIIQRKE